MTPHASPIDSAAIQARESEAMHRMRPIIEKAILDCLRIIEEHEETDFVRVGFLGTALAGNLGLCIRHLAAVRKARPELSEHVDVLRKCIEDAVKRGLAGQ